MKHHFKNAFAAVHISLQSFNCELYLSKPLKKRGGLSGGCEGGEKRKEFLPNKRAPRNWYNFAGSYSQPTQHFFLYTDIPESQQGAFFPAKIQPSANLTTTREKYNNLVDAKESTVKWSSSCVNPRATFESSPWWQPHTSACPAHCLAKQEPCLLSWQELFT